MWNPEESLSKIIIKNKDGKIIDEMSTWDMKFEKGKFKAGGIGYEDVLVIQLKQTTYR